MMTKEVAGDMLLAYLNGRLSLEELVDWAEQSFIDAVLAPDEDMDMLNDTLAYLAAADTEQFPLTWEVCHEFLERLGLFVKVVVETA